MTPILDGIGDLQIVDISGNSTTVSSNKDKAEELGKFFSSVFTVEQEQSSSSPRSNLATLRLESWSLMNKLF